LSASRVLLVDDHSAFREPLAFMFEREPEFEVVGQADSLAEARRVLGIIENEVDLAVVDLPDGDGTELVGELRAANPRAMVLVLTASINRETHARAVEAGAAGVLDNTSRNREVNEASQPLVGGESILSPEEVVELLRLADRRRERDREAERSIEQLTPREWEVLRLLAEGLSDKEIAERLYVGSGTVRNHVVSIFGKLGVHSRLQALLFAVRYGLIDVE
jgi:DNA-binding NarL/FixJ family response regulator